MPRLRFREWVSLETRMFLRHALPNCVTILAFFLGLTGLVYAQEQNFEVGIACVLIAAATAVSCKAYRLLFITTTLVAVAVAFGLMFDPWFTLTAVPSGIYGHSPSASGASASIRGGLSFSRARGLWGLGPVCKISLPPCHRTVILN